MKKLLKMLVVVFVISALTLTLVACADPCKNGHTWDEGTVDKAPTCTETGLTTYKCLKCDATEQRSTEKIAHTPKDVSVAPTCTTAGTTGATECKVCGTAISAGTVVNALGHDYTGQEWKLDDSGAIDKHYQECKNGCGERNEHDAEMGDWALIGGKHVRTCTADGCSYSENHNPNMGSEWKHDNDGYYKECEDCGLQERETAHDFEGQPWLVDEDNDKHYQECKNGCGTRNEHAIALGAWHEEGGNHVHACTVEGCTWAEMHAPAFGSLTSIDETNHCKTCTKCDLTTDFGAHNPVATEIDGNDAQHSVACACGKTYPDANHEWTLNTTETKPATCTEAGERTYTCAVCNYVKTETIAAIGHDYDGQPWLVDEANGKHYQVCANGCDIRNEHAIAFDEGTVTTEPDCTNAGVKTYTCSVCGTTKTEPIEALGHDWNEGEVTTQPTCTAEGVKTYTCKRTGCGETRTESIAKIDHTWNAGEITTQPTCTDAGEKTYTCTVCGGTKTESVEATGHDYDGQTWLIDETNNKHYQLCANGCGTRNEHAIAFGAWGEADGKHVRTCTATGCTISENHDPAMSDAWKNDDDGLGYYKDCAICGFKKYEGEHVYTGQPWQSDVLTHYQLCANGCGEHGNIANHKFTNNVCDTCGYIISQDDIIAKLADLTAYDSGTFVLTGTYGLPQDSKGNQHELTDVKSNTVVICYRLANTSSLVAGDTITVTGNLVKYGDIYEFDAGCTYKFVKGVEYSIEADYNAEQVTIDNLPDKYERDKEITFTITAKDGYRIDGVTLNGVALTSTDGTYKITITATNKIVVVSSRANALPPHNASGEIKTVEITNSDDLGIGGSSYTSTESSGTVSANNTVYPGFEFNFAKVMKSGADFQLNGKSGSNGEGGYLQVTAPADIISITIQRSGSGTMYVKTVVGSEETSLTLTNGAANIFGQVRTIKISSNGAIYVSSISITYDSSVPCANSQDPTHVEYKAAQCTVDGNKEHWVCPDCNKIFVKNEQGIYVEATADSVVIKASHTKATTLSSGVVDGKHSHWYECTVCGEKLDVVECTPTTITGTPATCTTAGKTDGSKCSICDQVITEQTDIDALGHSYVYTPNGDGTHNGACSRNCGEDGATITNANCAAATDASWQIDGDNHWKLCALCGGVVEQAAHDGNDPCACGAVKPTFEVVDAGAEGYPAITSHDIDVTMPAYAAIGSEITVTITSQRFEVILVESGSGTLEAQGDNTYKGVLQTATIKIYATELTGNPTYTGVTVTGAASGDVSATVKLNGTELVSGTELAEGNVLDISVLYMPDEYDVTVVVTQGSNNTPVELTAQDEMTFVGAYTCLALGDVSIEVIARAKATVTIPAVSNATISVGKVVDDGDPAVVNNGDTVLVGDKLTITVTADTNYKATYTTTGLDAQGVVTGDVTITVTVAKLVKVEIDSSTSADIELIVDPEGELELTSDTTLEILASVAEGVTDKIIGKVTVNGESTGVTGSDGSYSYTIAYDSIAAGAILKISATLTDKPAEVVKQWTLVTDMSQLSVGSQVVIVAKDSNYAISTTQQSNNRKATTITKSSDKNTITIDDSVQQFTLEKGYTDSTFALKTDTGYLYAAGGTSTSNYMRTEFVSPLDAKHSWTITINSSDYAATIKSADSSCKRNTIMKNSSSAIFSCYASGQQAVVIYVLTEV